MDNITNLLTNLIKKSTKLLKRDYFELQELQNSKQLMNFTNRCLDKFKHDLQKNLSQYYKALAFSFADIVKMSEIDSIMLIDIMDGKVNFTRSLPFFGVVVTQYLASSSNRMSDFTVNNRDLYADRVVIYFPALDELYYAIKGKGAWTQRDSFNIAGSRRMRVSQSTDIDNMVIATDLSHFGLASTISNNIRIFGSDAYTTSMFVAGAIDLCIFNKDTTSQYGLKLLIQESSGQILTINNKDLIVASNLEIATQIEKKLNNYYSLSS